MDNGITLKISSINNFFDLIDIENTPIDQSFHLINFVFGRDKEKLEYKKGETISFSFNVNVKY